MTLTGGPGSRAGAELLDDLRTEISRADAKATVLAGTLSMSAGLLGGLLAGRGWSPSLLSAPATALWWTGVAFLAVALFSLLLAVVPRYRRSHWRSGQPLTYFGDVQRAARAGQLGTALTETGRHPDRGLLTTLAVTSRIVSRKHLWIRAGLIAFGCAALLLPGSLLIT
ncbi:Pycsar system effector family protein [Streptomyces sp. NPDC050439]|uniref:Pycsar system effector family protein n=1 Tax=unclassified Streptomyces TaxID=2593676 RepID=UPI003442DE15